MCVTTLACMTFEPWTTEAEIGAGDWVMCTAQIKRAYAARGLPVLVIGGHGRPVWSEVFLHNPKVLKRPHGRFQKLISGGGVRPYIADKSPARWTWKRWPIEPGEIFLSADEKRFGAQHGGKVVVEPHTKVAGGNKAWPWDRWQQLADRFPGALVQVGPPGTRTLRGVPLVVTPTFRHACAVLSASRAFAGCEGGLHHAAAALGVPAVVLFSEFISPEYTGYALHRNLRHAGEACGMRTPCDGCRQSMLAITVDEVERNLREITVQMEVA